MQEKETMDTETQGTTELVAAQPKEVMQAPVTQTLEMIERMAINPDVDADKMGKLVDLQLKIMDRQAEIDFNQAKIALKEELPIIKKNGVIDYGGNKKPIAYAKIEDIQKEIDPICLKHGFTFSFDQDDNVHIATLIHRAGHKEISRMTAPPDSSGGKNAIQGIVSAGSYCQRILMKRLLNLVFEGDDDDGNGGPISDKQAEEIKTGLKESGLNVKKFLENLKVSCVEEIPLREYQRCLTAIDARKFRNMQKEQKDNG